MSGEAHEVGEQAVEQAFLGFARDSLVLIAELEADTPFTEAAIRQVFHTRGWTYASDQALLYREIASQYRNRFHTLGSSQPCLEAHIVAGIFRFNETISDGLGGGEYRMAQEMAFLLALLRPVTFTASRLRTLTPTQDQLLADYREFRREWTATARTWETTSPLLNFECALTEVLNLIDGLQLGPFMPDDKATIWEIASSHLEDYIGIGVFAKAKFRLMASYTMERKDEQLLSQDDTNVARMGRWITALRLWKSGRVGSVAAFNYPIMVSGRSGFGSQTTPDYEVGTWGEPYTLDLADLPSVAAIYNILSGGGVGKLGVGLRRFNQSYTRSNADDRIIDMTIALESSLLVGLPTATELKNRFSLRGAALLAAARHPRETKALLDAIYDTRSKIVHTGLSLHGDTKALKDLSKSFQRLTPPISPLMLPDRTEDVTRAILNEYLRRLQAGKSLETINTELDDRLVEGLITTPPSPTDQ